MNIRLQEIGSQFREWLERFTPPREIRDKPKLEQAEAESLLRVLLKFAPDSDYRPWVSRALERVEYQMKTRAWPTKFELGAACSNLRKERAPKGGTAAAYVISPAHIIAKKLRAGEAVGDGWLWGRSALDLLATGDVLESDLTRYRSALFFAMKDTWGEEVALEKEAVFKARHEAAVRLRNLDMPPEPPRGEPFRRMETVF